MKVKQTTKENYIPSEQDKELLDRVYKNVHEMIDRRSQNYAEFNNKTLKRFVDDGDKRLNAYVMPKDAYDPPKDDWQSNLVLTTIRDKQKKILAGFSLQVPDMETKAFGEDSFMDVNRADIAKWLIRGSYTQEENSTVENFWEAWECSSRGTVIKYEGYLKTRVKQKYIKSYDIVTGKIESEEREVDVDDKCISLLVPLTEFYPWDFYVHGVQDQPRVAWIRYYDEDVFEYEFGKYKNAEYVEHCGKQTEADTTTFYYKNEWEPRTGGKKIEVIRYYDRLKDEYVICANGVLLLNAPLLWRVNGSKVYPFAKSIWEPFANKDFFYGNSFPNLMSGDFDHYNTLFNTISDKQFRSMVPPLLVGAINKDALDLEDEIITHNGKITVEDISQVRELNTQGISNADVLMLQLITKNIEDKVPTMPDLIKSGGRTAREIIIAQEKLQELKVLYNEMMTDLWRQKCYLRLANIQQNYPQPRRIVDEDGKEKTINRTYIIENAELDKKTGEIGILAVQFRKTKVSDRRKIEEELGVEEEMMKQNGVNYKKVVVTPNFLDNYKFQIEIIPSSVYKQSLAREQASVLEKLDVIAKYFPQVFVVNQEEYFKQFAKSYEDNPDKYLAKLAQMKEQEKMAQDVAGMMGQGGQGGEMPMPEGMPQGAPPAPQGQGQGRPQP